MKTTDFCAFGWHHALPGGAPDQIAPPAAAHGAGLRNGVELPYSCKGGVCSTCRCRLLEGEVDMDVNFALEDYEVARGFILSCQSYPATDKVVIDFDQTGTG